MMGSATTVQHQLHILFEKLIQTTCRACLAQVWKLEHQLLPVVYQMKQLGIKVDRAQLEQVERQYGDEAKELAGQIRQQLQLPDLNVEANEAVLNALQGIGVNITSTAAEDLSDVEHPVASLLIRYRRSRTVYNDAAKCRQAADDGDRIHPDWDPLGTGTGRFTCKNPPLQSLSGNPDLRRCFVPAEGHAFVHCDYAQADLRPIAYLSEDQAMLEIFRSGQDFHRVTAANLLKIASEEVTPDQRKVSKAVVFGLTYGMGADKLAKEARCKFNLEWTTQEAEEYIQSFYGLYPGLRAWRETNQILAKTKTECRTVLLKRRRLLPEGQTHEYYRFARLLNTPAQGTVADALKEAMVQIWRKLGDTNRIVANFHDALVLEVPKDHAEEVAALVSDEMQTALGKALPDVPVVAEAKISQSLAD